MDNSLASADIGSTKAVQIIAPADHEFKLRLDVLKRILEVDNIKDHDVVVVSIAGAFRKGKSFLMNFFLKYLYAQVRVDIKSIFAEPSVELVYETAEFRCYYMNMEFAGFLLV